MNDFKILDPLLETFALDMQLGFESLTPVMPALLIWDWSANGEGGFRLKIYPRHANHPEEAIHIIDSLISVGIGGMQIDVDFTKSPLEPDPQVVCSLTDLNGENTSALQILRGD